MPKFLVPRKTGAHRIAAIALYRALLSQCRTVPFAGEQRTALCNIVRNRFKSNVNLQSTYLLRDAFGAGYEALNHLDASVSGDSQNTSSTSYIRDLLLRVPSHLTSAPPSPAPKPSPGAPLFPNPGAALLRRPLPQSHLSGKRHVPILVNANKIPILRLGKPQPESLSRYIKARIVQRQKRTDRRWDLQEACAMAKQEDYWDRVVERQGRLGQKQDWMDRRDGRREGVGEKEREPQWLDEQQRALDQVYDDLSREGEKNKLWAKRMQEIVDAEKELAEKERKEWKMRKNAERRARKRARESGGGTSTGEDGDNVAGASS